MKRILAYLTALTVIASPLSTAFAEDTGWQNRESFRSAVYNLTEQGLVPDQIAARIHDGEAQFRAKWVLYDPDKHSGFALYPLLGRADAKEAIATHTDTGGNIEVDELCLGRIATAAEGGAEAWLIYLVDRYAQGVRCIELPSK